MPLEVREHYGFFSFFVVRPELTFFVSAGDEVSFLVYIRSVRSSCVFAEQWNVDHAIVFAHGGVELIGIVNDARFVDSRAFGKLELTRYQYKLGAGIDEGL